MLETISEMASLIDWISDHMFDNTLEQKHVCVQAAGELIARNTFQSTLRRQPRDIHA